jgi:hypothetical protein
MPATYAGRRKRATSRCVATALSRPRSGHAPYHRLFTLVGRTDREVVRAQILWLWAPRPGSRGPPTPRSVNSSPYPHAWRITVREVGGVDVFPLPCADDSRRAKACDRLVPDGAPMSGDAMTDTTDPRVNARIDALPGWQQAFRREVRQLVHAADSQVTETIKRTEPPLLRPGGPHSSTAGASSPTPRRSSPAAMSARPAAPWPSGTAKQSPHPC